MVHLSTHFLENVIDANQYPLPEITELAQRIRRIGLGVMGLADVFVRLGIPYDSEEGVALGRKIQQFVDEEAKVEIRAAGRRARRRSRSGSAASGVRTRPAPATPRASGSGPMRRLRNCNVTTVAPTGTISIIAGCSSGIEPLFAVAFMRNQAGVLMPDVNEDFVAIAKREGWYSRRADATHRRGRAHRFPRGAGQVAAGVRHRQRTSSPSGTSGCRRRSRSTTTSAISKTCNFATRRHRGVRRGDLPAGLQARLQGRHGLPRRQPRQAGALHRRHRQEGARAGTRGKSEAPADLALRRGGPRATLADLHGRDRRAARPRTSGCGGACTSSRRRTCSAAQKRSRPELLRGTTRRLETPLGTMYVTITEDDRGQPFEVFMSLGKAGGALMADVEAMGRLIRLALRSGIPMKEIYRQLRGISSDRAIGLGPEQGPLGARRRRHRHRAVDAGEAGHPAGAAARRAPRAAGPTTGAGGGAASGRRRAGGEQMMLGGMQETLSGRVPRLRLAARVRRGVHEVPRVRLQRVRVIVVIRS